MRTSGENATKRKAARKPEAKSEISAVWILSAMSCRRTDRRMRKPERRECTSLTSLCRKRRFPATTMRRLAFPPMGKSSAMPGSGSRCCPSACSMKVPHLIVSRQATGFHGRHGRTAPPGRGFAGNWKTESVSWKNIISRMRISVRGDMPIPFISDTGPFPESRANDSLPRLRNRPLPWTGGFS